MSNLARKSKNELVPRSLLEDYFDRFNDEFFFPIQTEFDRFFDGFFNDKSVLSRVKGKAGYPKMDIVSEDGKWSIRAAVPGVDPKAIKVEVEPNGDFVRISGEMSEEYRSPEGSKYMVTELHKSRFSREVSIPDFVEGDPEATIKDGIITLTWKANLPKPEEKSQPKLIEVKTKE
jgi:HSP20 family molecular chaperone IbpA